MQRPGTMLFHLVDSWYFSPKLLKSKFCVQDDAKMPYTNTERHKKTYFLLHLVPVLGFDTSAVNVTHLNWSVDRPAVSQYWQ